MNDDQIVDEVSEWEKDRLKFEREKFEKEFELKKEKSKYRRKFFEKSLMIILSFGLAGWLYHEISCGMMPLERQEFNNALKECVDSIGSEKCLKIKQKCPPYPCTFKNEESKNYYGECIKALNTEKCAILKKWNGYE